MLRAMTLVGMVALLLISLAATGRSEVMFQNSTVVPLPEHTWRGMTGSIVAGELAPENGPGATLVSGDTWTHGRGTGDGVGALCGRH